MFIVSISYKVSLEQVDQYIPAHVEYLERHYQTGDFIVSGAKVPRTGGVILARASSRKDLQRVLEQDPFYQAGIAEYDITEFTPSKFASGLEGLAGV